MDIPNPHFCPDLLHELLFWRRLFNLRIRGALKNNSMIMLISSIIMMTIKAVGIIDLKKERIAWKMCKVRF